MATFARVIGRLLRPFHAGERHLAWFSPALRNVPDTLIVTSPIFTHNQPLPPRCAGAPTGCDTSPPLSIGNIPERTREVVLIAQDPDAPFPRPVLHALLTHLPPSQTTLAEGTMTTPGPFHLGQVHGGKLGYTGPKPPPGHGPHRYMFQVIASDIPLEIASPPRLQAVLAALAGHAIARGRIIGTFENP